MADGQERCDDHEATLGDVAKKKESPPESAELLAARNWCAKPKNRACR